jgi:hypothetical protein
MGKKWQQKKKVESKKARAVNHQRRTSHESDLPFHPAAAAGAFVVLAVAIAYYSGFLVPFDHPTQGGAHPWAPPSGERPRLQLKMTPTLEAALASGGSATVGARIFPATLQPPCASSILLNKFNFFGD